MAPFPTIWTIEFVPAAKELKALDRQVARRIVRTLEKRIAASDDPRALGAALAGEHARYWRWRIGDYRVVARIEDERVTILVVRVAHRRAVYRQVAYVDRGMPPPSVKGDR